MGTLAVLLLGLGVARVGGRRAGLAAAALLATNFVSVMYDRAALMEATMVSLVVTAWYCYARADESPRWGLAAGAAAIAAYFTKASAVFFLPALAGDALLTLAAGARVAARAGGRRRPSAGRRLAHARRAWSRRAWSAVAAFVLPNWQDYRFYNWQMSVVRKPAYTLKALVGPRDVVPGRPRLLHPDVGRRRAWRWAAAWAWSSAGAAWRLPSACWCWWIVLGVAELVLHDVGNERRFVFLIPALVGLASLAIARDRRCSTSASAACR